MNFPAPLIPGTLLQRRQRFLADVVLADGAVVTAHCPNTGSLLGCAVPGSRVWLSPSAAPHRRYPLTWELVEVAGGVLVGINTGLANRLVRDAIEAGVIAGLQGYDRLRAEVPLGPEGSRIDLLLEGAGGQRCYVEVKSVTAALDGGIGLFPDAVTARGTRHVRALMAAVEAGHRGVVCFCVLRGDAVEVRPADAIDPAYGQALRRAVARGVEAIACRAQVSLAGIDLRDELPVVLPA
jgi:sugar fermentation stimulation protein A